MKVAFVGVKRKYQELAPEYKSFFNQYHLELPYYYARGAGLNVTLTTVDHSDEGIPVGMGVLRCMKEEEFQKNEEHFDVVVHWRKWFPELYRPEAINMINCQDHSFSSEWKVTAMDAYAEGKLHGILCFPTWHKRNLLQELNGALRPEHAIDGLTLGVDTDVYKPSVKKDPYQLLWASDPGRGLNQVYGIFGQLYAIDQRFRLNVCYPDYCAKPSVPSHPGIIDRGNVPNGPGLWDLFNNCGILVYPSTFMEPSSRAHRQAMAAGSLVLYPPGRGSPSELIQHLKTGYVCDTSSWPAIILGEVQGHWKEIGDAARQYAISENWDVQAERFEKYFSKILGGKR